jgi:hypothetical protein
MANYANNMKDENDVEIAREEFEQKDSKKVYYHYDCFNMLVNLWYILHS